MRNAVSTGNRLQQTHGTVEIMSIGYRFDVKAGVFTGRNSGKTV